MPVSPLATTLDLMEAADAVMDLNKVLIEGNTLRDAKIVELETKLVSAYAGAQIDQHDINEALTEQLSLQQQLDVANAKLATASWLLQQMKLACDMANPEKDAFADSACDCMDVVCEVENDLDTWLKSMGVIV